MASRLSYITPRAYACIPARLALIVSVMGCAEQVAPEVPRASDNIADACALPLIDHSEWSAYRAADDPLRAHQPDLIRCGPGGYFVEFDRLEVDSQLCNYVLLLHPAQQDVAAGEEVTLELSHFDLTASEPAQAHVALLFDGTLAWETWLDIPGPANVVQAVFRAPRALARGEPLRFHLHNHGQNTYALGRAYSCSPSIQSHTTYLPEPAARP